MRYKRIITIIFIIMQLISCTSKSSEKIILPEKMINVLVLSKYRLKKIRFYLKNAVLYTAENSYSLKNIYLNLRKEPGLLRLEFEGKILTSSYLSIVAYNSLIKAIYEHKARKEYRNYSDEIMISAGSNSLEIVNRTDAEKFIKSAARAELGELLFRKVTANPKSGWQKELLIAMQIIIRSYLFHFKDRHNQSQNYQFCDLTHCVHFPGILKKSQIDPAPLIAMYDKKSSFIPAYFHSTCGGELSGPEKYWPDHNYYYNFRQAADKSFFWKDPNCKKSPHFKWQKKVSKQQLNKILKNSVQNIKLHKAEKSLRNIFLSYTNQNAKVKQITVHKFLSRAGRVLGWSAVKSNYFEINKTSTGWIFTGYGLGHGVGMCQWGAVALAQKGYSYREIINFYYNHPLLVQGEYSQK